MKENGRFKIRISKYRIAVFGAIVFILAFLGLLALALKPMFIDGENALRARNNTAVEKARVYPQDSKARAKITNEAVTEFVNIAEGTKDPLTKSVAYSNAAMVLLKDFVENDSRSFSEVNNAIEYYTRAARICVDYKNPPCFFGKNEQSNLDYAVFLKKSISSKGPKGGVVTEKPVDKLREKDRKDKKDSKKEGAKTTGATDSPTARDERNDSLSEHRSPVGSIRGALSKDPSDITNPDYFEPGGGGNFTIPPNEP